MAAPQTLPAVEPPPAPSCQTHESTMELILQEVRAVGHRLEGMDTKISYLAAETKFIHINISDFQDRVEEVERRLTAVEDCFNTVLDRY
ncbi:hypothetical protein NDU88_002729 [Pleurodeles waltl]|uniref:Uncharacterized protein n=1 Tax=Pleurodeles waltl TaxID=8319 RepID=A0AAV7P7G8_PLEWA|nr:hypothetical protein NDU88_002729 [Pleurodeles waltl]